MAMLEVERSGRWNFGDLGDLPNDGSRYEVVDGNLLVTPPPTQLHQFVSQSLQRALELTMPAGWQSYTDFSLPWARMHGYPIWPSYAPTCIRRSRTATPTVQSTSPWWANPSSLCR